MKIRLETPQDYLEVEEMVRDSFWNVYRPGAFEHYIVHRLRQDESLISNLAYVIELNGKIIAHINYCEGKLDFQNKKSVNAAILGPIAVKKDYQNQGYGSRLINFTLNLLGEKNIPFVFVVGDENYYHRFGFESASKYGIYLNGSDTTQECPFFMIKIIDDENKPEEGIFTIPDVFDVDESEVDKFDEKFEYRQKKVTEGQL